MKKKHWPLFKEIRAKNSARRRIAMESITVDISAAEQVVAMPRDRMEQKYI